MDNTQYGSKVRLGVMVDGEYVELGDCAVVQLNTGSGWIDMGAYAASEAARPLVDTSVGKQRSVTYDFDVTDVDHQFFDNFIRTIKRRVLRYRLAHLRKLYGRGVGVMTEPQICGRVLQAKLIHNLNYIGRSYRLKSRGANGQN